MEQMVSRFVDAMRAERAEDRQRVEQLYRQVATFPGSVPKTPPPAGSSRTPLSTCGARDPQVCSPSRSRCTVGPVVVDTNERILAMKLAKKVRPARRFSKGSALEFANVMAKFDLATNNPVLDARTKLLELEHYLEGPPMTIVSAYISHEDPDEAYARARAEIGFLYGKSGDSMAPLLEGISGGDQLGVHDLDGHIQLYAELRNAFTTASGSGRVADFSFEAIRKLVRGRLDHMSTAYFTKDQKCVAKQQRHLHFEELLSFIGQWVMVLSSKGAPQGGPASGVAVRGLGGEGPVGAPSRPRLHPVEPSSPPCEGPLTPSDAADPVGSPPGSNSFVPFVGAITRPFSAKAWRGCQWSRGLVS